MKKLNITFALLFLFMGLMAPPCDGIVYIADENPVTDTTYDPMVNKHLKALSLNILQPLKEHFKSSLFITSSYRSEIFNRSIKGAINSQHISGEAVDIDVGRISDITNREIFEFIRDNLNFDQLIWEYGTSKEPDWVHVSFTKEYPNKKQVLVIEKINL